MEVTVTSENFESLKNGAQPLVVELPLLLNWLQPTTVR